LRPVFVVLFRTSGRTRRDIRIDNAFRPIGGAAASERRRRRPAIAAQLSQQPPTTPHAIYDDYKFGPADNRCLLCHGSSSADMTALTHAPRVSASHLVLRDGKTVAEVTPGHRFCVSCHVLQTDAAPPVGNTYDHVNRRP
jgi:nitrate reductase (cytochrome), electron transfer subunit